MALFGRAGPIQAQQASGGQTASGTDQAQEVVVTGIRYSLTEALTIKRDSVQNVEVIKADDIGKLPDKNVADAVQRLPGVNTATQAGGEGGFDENDRVAIRGTSPSLTQTTINGHAVASGDWFILDQYSLVGRSVSYTLLPAEIVGAVVVHKTQSADMTEGGVAGSVDIQTRRPLDLKHGLTAEAFLGAEYGSLAAETSPQANGLLSWKNDDSTFGVLGQVFYEERKVRRDGQEFLGYTPITAANDPKWVAAFPEANGAAIPNEIGSVLFEQTRKREGGAVDFQIKPSDQLTLDLNGFYSDLKADNQNRNYMLFLVSKVTGDVVPSSMTVQNGTVVAAQWPANTTNATVYDQIMRPGAEARTWYADLTGKYEANDHLTLSGQFGYTAGLGNTPQQPANETCQNGAFGYQMHGLNSTTTVNFADSGNYTGVGNCWGWTDVTKATDSETYGQIDALLKLDNEPFRSVKFGVRYAEHAHVVDFPVNGSCCVDWSKNADYTGEKYPSNFGSGLGGGLLTNIWQYSESAISSWVSQQVFTGPNRFYWPGESDVHEKDLAGYVMATVGGDHWSGNFGVRVVSTHVESIVNQQGGPNAIDTVPTNAWGPWTPTNYTNRYLDFLPSANLRFDLDKDLLLRFSAAQTMSRPDYSALGGAVTTTDLNWTANGGNPNLKPITAATYDTSLEWYFAPQSLLAVSLFYQDFSSYVDFSNSTLSLYNDHYGKVGIYTISRPFNTTAENKGFELSYQQPLGAGFGVQANFTHANGSTADGTPMVGNSATTYNAIGYWENKLLSVRLAYTYRSHFLVGLDRSYAENMDSVGTLDASVNVNLTQNISFSFDGLNLTDELLKYYGNNTTQPRAFYDNGRTYYAGVHVKF
jgi:iron complex outermembrane receptor protein